MCVIELGRRLEGRMRRNLLGFMRWVIRGPRHCRVEVSSIGRDHDGSTIVLTSDAEWIADTWCYYSCGLLCLQRSVTSIWPGKGTTQRRSSICYHWATRRYWVKDGSRRFHWLLGRDMSVRLQRRRLETREVWWNWLRRCSNRAC